MKLLDGVLLVVLLGAACSVALARGGHGGGGRGAGSHAGHASGAHAGGARVGGAHFSGSHVGRVRPRIGVGVIVAAPVIAPLFPPAYYSPYYSYPPAAAAPYSPPVYIEQPREPSAAEPFYWYCPGSQAYYPYVRDCPAGWQKVFAEPPPPS